MIDKLNYLGKNKIPFIFMIDFEMLNPIIYEINKININQLLYNFSGIKNYNEPKIFKKILFEKIPPNYSDYLNAFNIVKNNILLGNSYLTNLTFSSEIETNLTLKEIFYISKAKYKIWFDDYFTFFSPEIFVEIKNNKIFSYPMKGTIDADLPNAKEIILNDKKEISEHYTIVDLIRNDLNIVAKNIKVDKFRYIDTIKTKHKNLIQISSIISGDLPFNYTESIGSIIFSLMPAGSISGAPKKSTIEIIKKAEIHKRNYYTGIAGIFDGQNLDSCVMIRFIEKNNNKLFYKSGGGITFQSNPMLEYQELIDKIYIPN